MRVLVQTKRGGIKASRRVHESMFGNSGGLVESIDILQDHSYRQG